MAGPPLAGSAVSPAARIATHWIDGSPLVDSAVGVLARDFTEPARAQTRERLRDRLTWIIEGEVGRGVTAWGAIHALDQALAADAYVEYVRDRGLEQVYDGFPVLLDLVRHAAEVWAAHWCDVARWIDEDRAELDGLGARGPVVDVAAGDGDMHDGRHVAGLTFDSGATVFTKPRSVADEVAWDTLMAEVTRWLDQPEWPRRRVIDRGDHGWVAELDLAAPSDPVFAQRIGQALAVAYLLGSGDLIGENVGCVDDHPVPVDTEVILRSIDVAGSVPEGMLSIGLTVLPVLMLPYYRPARGGRDAMVMDALGELARSRPQQVIDGCMAAVHAVMAHREQWLRLLDDDGPFARVRVRILIASTSSYRALLDSSLSTGLLRDRSARRTHIESTLAAMKTDMGHLEPWLADIDRSEADAIERLDIPRFTMAATGHRLEPAGVDLLTPPLGHARERVDLLPAVLAWQPVVIAAALAEPLPSGDRDVMRDYAEWLEQTMQHGWSADRQQRLTWSTEPSRWGFDIGRADLHTGEAGAALALLAQAPDSPDAHAWLRRLGGRQATGRGMAWGPAGQIFAVAWARRRQPEAADPAAVATLVDPLLSPLDPASDLDLYHGVAGEILGLLTVTPRSEQVREAVLARVQLLLDRADPGTGAWVASNTDQRWTGAAHGTAGIAMALVRCWRELGSEPALRAAERAMCWERDLLLEDGSLPYLAKPEHPHPLPMGYCHGMAGNVITRLAMIDDLGSRSAVDDGRLLRQLSGDVARMLPRLVDEPPGGATNLCCGEAARIEALCLAADQLGQPRLRERANVLLTSLAVRDRDRATMTMAMEGPVPPALNGGLFSGYAGVLHACARVTNPGVPALLDFR